MIDDIAAIQYLYGVNQNTNVGDTTYTLGSFSTDSLSTIYASIWDAGGNDTFSWADQNTIAAINLNAGSFSYFGAISGVDDTDLKSDSVWSAGDGLLGIAYDAVIENAIGGSNSDTIIGNNAANILYGGAGIGVQDTLTGGAGIDTFVCLLSDSTANLFETDIILDFTDGEDLIGLGDTDVSELAWSASDLDLSDTQIYEVSSLKNLFILDNFNYALLDQSDFLQTDFV